MFRTYSWLMAPLRLRVWAVVCAQLLWAQPGSKKTPCQSERWLQEIQQKIEVEGHWDEAYTLWDTHFSSCERSEEAWYRWGDVLLENRWSFAAKSDKSLWVKKRLAFYTKYDQRFPAKRAQHAVDKALLLAVTPTVQANVIAAAFEQAVWQRPEAFLDAETWTYRYQALMQWYAQVKPKYADWVCEQLWAEGLTLQLPQIPERSRKYNYLMALWSSHFSTVSRLRWAEQQSQCAQTSAQALALLVEWVHQWGPDTPQFTRLAQQLESAYPSSASAVHMANVAVQQRQSQQAIGWYDKAVERSQDALAKAQWRSVQARLVQGLSKAKARNYLLEALRLDPQNIQYIKTLMDLYAQKETCGDTADQKLLFALAYACCVKIEGLNAAQGKALQANKLYYQSQMPNAATLQQLPRQDGKVFVGCWLQDWVEMP